MSKFILLNFHSNRFILKLIGLILFFFLLGNTQSASAGEIIIFKNGQHLTNASTDDESAYTLQGSQPGEYRLVNNSNQKKCFQIAVQLGGSVISYRCYTVDPNEVRTEYFGDSKSAPNWVKIGDIRNY